jgi:uncharacterized protein (TIGR01777 family)
MKVVVTGATGFIGAPLCRALRASGHAVVALSRRGPAARTILGEGIDVVEWDARGPGSWEESLAGAGGVINLAGEPLAAKAWTPRQKELLRSSRVETTKLLVAAIERAEPRPSVLISGSGIGYYGPHGDETLTEESPPGDDFVAGLVREWEAAATAAEALGVRVVRLRTGMVLGEGGGALAKMVPPFRAFVGGPLGSGRQWVSWIHRDDEIGIARWALEEERVRGAVNATAPHPATMREFARALGRALGRPAALPAPALALRALMGEMADIVLTGQRVLPAVAQSLGYTFRYPELDGALRSILGP